MRVKDAEEYFEIADGERHLRAEAGVDGEVAGSGNVAILEAGVSGARVHDRVHRVEVSGAEAEVAIAKDGDEVFVGEVELVGAEGCVDRRRERTKSVASGQVETLVTRNRIALGGRRQRRFLAEIVFDGERS